MTKQELLRVIQYSQELNNTPNGIYRVSIDLDSVGDVNVNVMKRNVEGDTKQEWFYGMESEFTSSYTHNEPDDNTDWVSSIQKFINEKMSGMTLFDLTVLHYRLKVIGAKASVELDYPALKQSVVDEMMRKKFSWLGKEVVDEILSTSKGYYDHQIDKVEYPVGSAPAPIEMSEITTMWDHLLDFYYYMSRDFTLDFGDGCGTRISLDELDVYSMDGRPMYFTDISNLTVEQDDEELRKVLIEELPYMMEKSILPRFEKKMTNMETKLIDDNPILNLDVDGKIKMIENHITEAVDKEYKNTPVRLAVIKRMLDKLHNTCNETKPE